MLLGLAAAASLALTAPASGDAFFILSIAVPTGLASLLVGIGTYLAPQKPRLGQRLLWIGTIGLIFPGGLTILFPYLILPAITFSFLAALLNRSRQTLEA